VFVPIEKIDPEDGLQLTVILFPLESDAEAEYVTRAPSNPTASTNKFGGTFILGGSEEISLLLEAVEDEDDGEEKRANTSRIKFDEIPVKISIAITNATFIIVMPVPNELYFKNLNLIINAS
jgi:hypothetical protein